MLKTKKDIWLDAEKICLATGSAVAKNHMFETKDDQDLFLKLWNQYLGEMTKLINYQLTSTTWIVLFKTKSHQEIQQAYIKQRKKSNKAKSKYTLSRTEKILSEHFRIFLSQYAKKMNVQNQRKGTLVLECFRKYVCQTYADYVEVFTTLTKRVKIKTQQRKKYQSHSKKYIKQKIRTSKKNDKTLIYKTLKNISVHPFYVVRKYFSSHQIPPNSS